MAKTCLVTGATGHLGSALLRDLESAGYNIKVLLRQKSPLGGILGVKFEPVYGDINDIESLRSAFDDVDVVIHMAAMVEIGRGHNHAMMHVNYEGTKNVVDVCIEKKVGRLIYVSTSHVVEFGKNNKVKKGKKEIFTECDEFDYALCKDGYSKSKLKATEYVFEKVKSGEIDAVVLYPSGVMGPFAYRVSNTHQMILEYIAGHIRCCVTGSYSFVDVRDVSKAIVTAIEKGKSGEGYLLTAENVTVVQMFKYLEEKTGVKCPKIVLPLWFVVPLSPLAELWYKLRRKKPLFSKTALKTLDSNSEFLHTKAERDLDFHPMSVKQSIFDATDFALFNKQTKINKLYVKKTRRQKKLAKKIRKQRNQEKKSV